MQSDLPTRHLLRRLAYLAVSTSLGALAMASGVSPAHAQFVCSGYESGPVIQLPQLQLLDAAPQASAQALQSDPRSVGDGGSLAWDYGSVACGKYAYAGGRDSTAVGFNTAAGNGGGRSVAVGSGAYAGTFGYGNDEEGASANATAVGTSSLAGNRAAAFGADANANIDAAAFGAASYAGQRSVAVGGTSYANGTDSVAVGYGANGGDLPGQVAIGANARISPTVAGSDTPLPGYNVALGRDSLAARGAQANYAAYGLDAPANSIGEVSVGTASGNRQITGVAPGSAGTDAVNVDQLSALGTQISSMSGQVNGFGSRLTNLEGQGVGSIPAPVSAYVPVDTSNASGLARPAATGADALALGYGASAGGTKSVAVGRAVASAARAAAFGDGAVASGTDGVALGAASVASGNSSTAVGTGARATGLRSLALGAGSSAENDNATAIGAGARTTRANQVAVGTTSSTYTMGGLASANSRAQQSGPAYFATTDAQGNLAATTFDTTRIDTMDNHISAVDQRVGNVENRVGNVENRVGSVERNVGILRNDVRRNSEGVSIAMAMAGVQLAPEKTYSLSANWGTFEGENGFAATGAARVSDSTVIHAGVGVGGNRGTVGGRAGVTFGW